MALNFPDSPNLNDTYSLDDKTWVWNGYGWKLQSTTNVTNLANSAFIQANSAFDHANAAFDAANNSVDLWVRDAANSASSYANSAFESANSAGVYANSAFEAANNATDTYVRNHANAAFDQANTNASDIIVLQGVDATQNTSITNLEGVNLTQNTNITNAQSTASGAFDHANAAFETANSSGASVAVSDSPPDSPTANSLWWQSNTGTLKIYYSDGDSSQWVEVIAIPTTLVDQFARDTANNASGSSIALAIALG